MPTEKRKRVLVVGGGAAGMSCAATLANHPEKFEVTVLEREPCFGGQATSIPLDESIYKAQYLNDGVQGGSGIFRHTFAFFKAQGYEAKQVQLQISFGRGADGFWSNVFPSKLVERFDKDIKRFGKALKIIKALEVVFAFIPVSIALRLFWFSREFGDKMVYPLMALFLGTGNQTANVSTAILERLFLDPNMKLWDYSPDTLLPNLPTMYTFPHLSAFYEDWAADLKKKGVCMKPSHELIEILERSKKGVTVSYRVVRPDPNGEPYPAEPGTFDELVMAVLADDAKRLLGKQAGFLEKRILGSAQFFDDVTITHSDAEYFAKYYETTFSRDLVASESKIKGTKVQEQIQFATKNFNPMYFTHSYDKAPEKIEMSFDCTNYQQQFPPHGELTPDKHVYQTIFLDKESSALWTRNEICPDKIIKEKWWHQLGHNWQHYLQVVPWMMFINSPGKKTHTQFIGSWTLVNMHELACVSGISAACALGADYLKPDDFAEEFFRNYYLLSHGGRFKGKVNNA